MLKYESLLRNLMVKFKYDLGNTQTFQLVVLGDLHVGDECCDMDLIQEAIAYVQQTPHCYAILNGDLMNNALKTSKSDSYKEKMTMEQQQETLIQLLYPIRNKILVVCSGNHEYRTNLLAGINPLKAVAYALGVADKFTEDTYILRLDFGKVRGTKSKNKYIVFGMHGSGGGRRIGSTANTVHDMAKIFPDMDLYIHSHTHNQVNFSDMILLYNNVSDKVVEHQRTFYNANAFLKYGGYGERQGFTPTDRTPNTVVVSAVRKNDEMKLVTNVIKIV